MTKQATTKIERAAAAALAVLAASLLLVAPAKPAEAVFPGKNAKIAFSAFDGNDQEIFTINPNGTGLEQLTDNEADDDPSYSPDSERILFESDRDGFDDIFSMEADGSKQKNLTKTPDEFENDPNWSPDGTKQKNLTKTPNEGEFAPVFSPDGKEIAFEKNPPDTIIDDIFKMKADGSEVKNVTESPDEDDAEPDWGTRK